MRRTRSVHLQRLRGGLGPAVPVLYLPYLFTRSTACGPPARWRRRSARSWASDGGPASGGPRPAAPAGGRGPGPRPDPRPAPAPQGSLEGLLAAKEIVIACGPGRGGQDHHGRRRGRHGRLPPRRAGAGADHRPGPPAGRRPGPRRASATPSGGSPTRCSGGRGEPARRAVGGHARHQGELGRPDPAPRPRRRDPGADPGQPAVPQHRRAGSSSPTTTSPWSASTRSTPRAATT